MIPRTPILLVAALAAAGCCGEGMNNPPVGTYVGEDAKVQLGEIRFAEEAAGARFYRLREDFAGRGDGQGWNHYPLRKIGNFVQEDWCVGPGSERTCAASSFRERRGAEWLGVYTLHYDSSWPEVFGHGVRAGKMPTTADWGAAFSYHVGGAGIMGEGLYASFSRFDGDVIAQEIHLGDSYSYTAEEEQIQIVVEGSRDEELRRLIASPESLRDTATAQLDRLLAEVEAKIEAGEITKCVYGEYNNDGIPPPCYPTALTVDETAALAAKARADIGEQRDAVVEHHALFHRLLVELVDFETCW